MQTLTSIYLGALVGLVIGFTGIGSGSLLTPLLILAGQASPAAVGTSIVASFGTKLFGSWSFHQRKMVHAKTLLEVSMGALPGAVTGALLIRYLDLHQPEQLEHILLRAIGVALTVVSVAMLIRLLPWRPKLRPRAFAVHPVLRRVLLTAGTFTIGFVFSLTSVGSGAALIPLLTFCYETEEPGEIVGTALVISTLMSAIAGFTHAELHTVDWKAVGGLLVGSVPAIWLASHIHGRVSRHLPQGLMAATMMVLGIHIILS